MTTRMLIDARHREETRVAVIKGNRIEEFDFESAEHKQLKGNIYLAKVTRVEPSLQAAFVDYGGNRHGFLAFSEIHPDYYQIPKEDREALLREEAEYVAQSAAMRAEEDLDELEGEVEDVQPPARLDDDDDDDLDDGQDDVRDGDNHSTDHHDDDHHDEDRHEDGGHVDRSHDERSNDGYDRVRDERDDDAHDDGHDDGERAQGDAAAGENADGSSDGRPGQKGRRRGRSREGGRDSGGRDSGGRDSGRERSDRGDRDEQVDFRRSLHRRYKIQDVIRRRQVLLVQVVKEERGTKGAALTSYLSLAGRYCVLMPNSSHGGGISRKISNNSDRKRLKSIIDDLALPPSMGCIVRTAGLERTKPEIKRDFDYLARLWDGIRETTLGSSAPALIHSDSDLIKRAIRDIYNSEIDEVSVEGEEGYRAAKDFMKLLMPSHARKVQQYADPVSLFQRYGVEDQLGAMYQPVVGLKSGGYLVINPTEALVSIDINSGRATREHNIEQTALNTNLEAAYEIGRQLRLRDMAGLVVIDFIDMEVNGNVRKVERAMKDALKNDRARIQVGRISGFGLMEMSRQRLRTGVLEASTRACPHCEGTGLVRTASSAGLSALRLLEEEAARGRGSRLVLRASQEAAFYVLNNKREELSAIEARYGVMIIVQSDGETEGARMSVEASGPPPANLPNYAPIIDEDDDVIVDEDVDEDEEEDGDEERSERAERNDGERGERSDRNDGERGDKSRRRRGRRRRGGRREDGEQRPAGDDSAAQGDAADDNRGDDGGDGGDNVNIDTADSEALSGEARDAGDAAGDAGDDAAAAGRRRRRGRRGGRNRRSDGGSESVLEAGDAVSTDDATAGEADDDAVAAAEEAPQADAASEVAPAADEKPKRRRRKAADVETAAGDTAPVEAAVAVEAEAAPAKPKRSRKPKADAAPEAAAAEAEAAPATPVADADAPAKPKRSRKPKAVVDDAASDAVAPPVEAEPATVTAMATAAEPVMVADIAPADHSDNGDAGDSAHAADPAEAASDADEARDAEEPVMNDDTPTGDKRRGWWQRTFGA